MENVKLPEVTDLSEQDRLDAFPMPEEGPMWLRVVDRRDCNLLCGRCLRVVGEGMTLLDAFEGAKHTARYLIRCTCGAHLQVPAQHGVGRAALMVEGSDGEPMVNPDLVKWGKVRNERSEPPLPKPPR